ncbi:MAG: DUF4249 domain-containing protein [Bacteroidota bacterium]
MKYTKPFLIILSILLLSSCIEEIDTATEFQANSQIGSFLVVEAILTNEPKRHEVILSRGISFGNDSTQAVESNATVSVVDDVGNHFSYSEIVPGTYASNLIFEAVEGRKYQLHITTSEGKTYQSDEEVLPSGITVDRLYAERSFDDSDNEGVGIFLDVFKEPEQVPLLRYEYEETYKIIAPLWSPLDMVLLNPDPPYAFGLVPREQEERVCYATELSNTIIQTSGLNITGESVEKIRVRFIAGDNYMISHRYSILVTQFVQDQDAFSYYRALEKQSTSENVFSEVQPGFIEGNIKNNVDSDEMVIGYFEVSNSTRQRIFFNYEDFFPNRDLPPYPINCNFLGAPPVIDPGGGSPLAAAIESGAFVYVRDNNGEVLEGGPYMTARRECGDCTVLGSNIVPEFWRED